MKVKTIWAIALSLLLIFLLAKCNGTGSAPEVRTAKYFLYVRMSNNTISGFSVNLSTGLLTKNPGSPYQVTNSLTGLSYDSGSNLLYATDSASYINVLSANPSTGDLTVQVRTPLAGSPTNIITLPPLKAFFTLGPSAGKIYGYIYGGNALVGSPYSGLSGGLQSLTTDPLNRFVFSGDNTGKVASYTNNGSGLTFQQSADTGGGGTIGSLLTDVTGQYLFVGDTTNGTVYVYAINQNTGALTAGPSYSVIISSMTIDILDHFLFVYNGGSIIIPYRINNNGASLTVLPTTTISLTTGGIAYDPTGHFVYAVDTVNGVFVYSINQSTGAGTLIQGPIAIGNTPTNQVVLVKLYN